MLLWSPTRDPAPPPQRVILGGDGRSRWAVPFERFYCDPSEAAILRDRLEALDGGGTVSVVGEGRPAPEPEPEPEPEPDPDAVCANPECGHEYRQHAEDGGACEVTGCTCEAFEAQEDGGEPASEPEEPEPDGGVGGEDPTPPPVDEDER